MKDSGNRQRLLSICGAAAGWFALTAQLYLIIVHRTTGLPETLIRYFGFFTILTNLLVACCFTAHALSKRGVFRQTGVQTAIAVYILVVGVVYNLVLRFLWQPQGLQWVVDELLHSLIPVFYLAYWWIYGRGQALRPKQAAGWLIYPFLYLCYTLIRGSITHYYPYPFLNIDKEGLPSVLLACILLTFVFWGLSRLFIALTRKKNKRIADR